MATIKQIAQLAGVSRGTVDRVLNGRGAVSEETAAKVRDIAAAMAYTPNKAGKSLAVRKKNLRLAFVIYAGAGSNPFFEDVLDGIDAARTEMQEYGVAVDVYHVGEGELHAGQVALLEKLQSQGYSGIAITPMNHPAVAAKIQALMDAGTPVVTVNTDIEGSGRLAYVGSDYYHSGATAAGLMALLCGGKAKVGIVTGFSDVLCHTQRVAGFCDNIEKNHPGMRVVQVCENRDDDAESHRVTQKLLEANPQVDALFLAAAGVQGAGAAVRQLGLAGKLHIVSFDTVPGTASLVRDGVIAATIGQQPFRQGKKPLEILFDYLTMGDVPQQDCYYTEMDIRIKENL